MSNRASNPRDTRGHNAAMPSEFLTFSLGAEEYALDIQRVQELRGYDSVTHIANAKEYIKGVINLRGVIVPIIDMRIKLNVSAPTYDQFTVVIILNLGNSVIGMVVDRVSDVINLLSEQIRRVPDLGAALEADYVIGLGTIDQRMLILVDIETLMSSTEFGSLERLVG
jgi:purine-binding chemotaxis protein CheW